MDYLEKQLTIVCERLNLSCRVRRASAFELPFEMRGAQRILEIGRALNARRYLNASGGRDLYDATEFHSAGIDLAFLDPYRGNYLSILYRLLSESPLDVRAEILA